ncbi:putative Transmembrane protein [Quillaja saponaria]|uniref:Transmembrane protein n=1 Tax=Quillaja saponaria TaxID=32244 RepID=A0AAD7KYD6_QUISA|nr:putative Transmembrane protein [Quillaja saponaria]
MSEQRINWGSTKPESRACFSKNPNLCIANILFNMGKLVLLCTLLAQILVVQAMTDNTDQPAPNPLELTTQTGPESHGRLTKIADQPVSSRGKTSEEKGESEAAEAPEIRRMGKHHSSDKSVAGGGVIIGGLVTAIFAAVFCYIRVTRKRQDAGVH